MHLSWIQTILQKWLTIINKCICYIGYKTNVKYVAILLIFFNESRDCIDEIGRLFWYLANYVFFCSKIKLCSLVQNKDI